MLYEDTYSFQSLLAYRISGLQIVDTCNSQRSMNTHAAFLYTPKCQCLYVQTDMQEQAFEVGVYKRATRTCVWSGFPLSPPQRVQNQPLSATVLIQRVQNGWKLSKRTYSKVGNQLFISWNSFHWADSMTYRHLKLGCLRWSWRTIMAIWKPVARRTTHISSELAQHLYNSILTQRLQWVAFFPILHNFGDGNVYGLEPSQHE
jgi:hypothetical protein